MQHQARIVELRNALDTHIVGQKDLLDNQLSACEKYISITSC